MKIQIRPIEENEIVLLSDFLYEAIFQRDEENPIPRSIIERPEIQVFIQDFGKRDDHCLVAVVDGRIVGAVWARILVGEVKGFGNIDDFTPEFAISLYKEYRGKGIGKRLMDAMLDLLRDKGYSQASLAVQKDNYAAKMYEKLGFCRVNENEEELIMVCKL